MFQAEGPFKQAGHTTCSAGCPSSSTMKLPRAAVISALRPIGLHAASFSEIRAEAGKTLCTLSFKSTTHLLAKRAVQYHTTAWSMVDRIVVYKIRDARASSQEPVCCQMSHGGCSECRALALERWTTSKVVQQYGACFAGASVIVPNLIRMPCLGKGCRSMLKIPDI